MKTKEERKEIQEGWDGADVQVYTFSENTMPCHQDPENISNISTYSTHSVKTNSTLKVSKFNINTARHEQKYLSASI